MNHHVNVAVVVFACVLSLILYASGEHAEATLLVRSALDAIWAERRSIGGNREHRE